MASLGFPCLRTLHDGSRYYAGGEVRIDARVQVRYAPILARNGLRVRVTLAWQS